MYKDNLPNQHINGRKRGMTKRNEVSSPYRVGLNKQSQELNPLGRYGTQNGQKATAPQTLYGALLIDDRLDSGNSTQSGQRRQSLEKTQGVISHRKTNILVLDVTMITTI